VGIVFFLVRWRLLVGIVIATVAGGTLGCAAVASKPARIGLVARTIDSSHVRLTWEGMSKATGYRVFRGDVLIGKTSGRTFTDALLWPETGYDYRVEAASGGTVIARLRASAKTAPLPNSGFPRPFSPGSFWNSPVASARVDPRSDQLMEYFASQARQPNLTVRRWGVSVAEARPTDPGFDVPCIRYRECTLGVFGRLRIPLTARPDPSADGHLAVYDPVRRREWGLYGARLTRGKWQALAGAAVSTRGSGLAPPRTAAANAANFPLLGGLIRPEEILQGRIDHALVFGMPNVGAGPPVCPATHSAGASADPHALREGQWLQLDPRLDVDDLELEPWQRTIARALQRYGMYLRDGAGTLSLYAETPRSRGYDAWARAGLPAGDSASLAGIPWTRMRVLAPPSCPRPPR
jgi:hypothetical protein